MEHQIDGIRWLRDRERSLLADEPGLGKSAQLLYAAKEPVLILAPAMVLDSGTWDDEIAKWAPGIDATQVPYTNMVVRRKNGRVLRGAHNVPIVDLKPELRRRWGTVIADESHYLKGRKTSWSVAAQKLVTDRFDQATGTPIPNWAHEAFMTLQIMHPSEAKPGGEFGSYWRWVNKWFDVEASYYNPEAKEIGDLQDRWTWDEFYQENWRDGLLLRLRKDCLDLPPLTQQRFMVDMTPEQARVYKQLKRDFIAWLDAGQELQAWSSGDLMVKLCKVATGLELLDPDAKSSGKLKALASLLEDRPRPTLVVAHFRDSVEACARVARRVFNSPVSMIHGGVPRSTVKNEIRAFQQGYRIVMCASIDMIREGMTLHQGGADQTIFVERSWAPYKNEQVLRRLHRIGLKVPVTSIDLVARDTYDIKILTRLAAKTAQQLKALRPHEIKELL